MLSLIRKKKGFTLVELGASLGVVGTLALVNAQESGLATSQEKARALGNEIFTYNAGVSRFLAANAGDSSVAGTQLPGSDWLKGSECSGGTASESFLSCDALPGGQTIQYGSVPTTTIEYSSEGALSARTVWTPVMGEGDASSGMVMGLAALVASGNYISQHNDAASGYQYPTVYCPGGITPSPPMLSICGAGGDDKLISRAGVSSTVEPWLRTDHGNTMRHVIEFNGDGDISTESELRSVEDRSGDSWLRQIVGVSRIYNGVGSSSQSLAIGSRSGDTIYDNPFLISNNLLNGAVILDGNVGVMNNFYVNSNAFFSNNITVDNDASVGRDITAGRNVRADNDVVAQRDVVAGRDVIASRDTIGKRFVDADNTSKYIDPASRSQINALTATGDIRASRFYDQNNINFYVDPATTSRVYLVDANRIESRTEVSGTLFRDTNNTSRIVDPSGRSSLNILNIVNTGDYALQVSGRTITRDLRVNRVVSEGSSCSLSGLVARDNQGAMLSCASGKWAKPGGDFTRVRTLPASGTAPSSGIMTVQSSSDRSLTCRVNGTSVGTSSARDKYGRGTTISSFGIGKGMSYSCSGSSRRTLVSFD